MLCVSKNDALKVPNLVGVAYDSTTIIWSWPDDEQYAHYLVEEAIDLIAKQIRAKLLLSFIGATSYRNWIGTRYTLYKD